MRVNYRHLDNYNTMLIVDNYYKIFKRSEIDKEGGIPSSLIEETLARGLKFDRLVEDLKSIND